MGTKHSPHEHEPGSMYLGDSLLLAMLGEHPKLSLWRPRNTSATIPIQLLFISNPLHLDERVLAAFHDHHDCFMSLSAINRTAPFSFEFFSICLMKSHKPTCIEASQSSSTISKVMHIFAYNAKWEEAAVVAPEWCQPVKSTQQEHFIFFQGPKLPTATIVKPLATLTCPCGCKYNMPFKDSLLVEPNWEDTVQTTAVLQPPGMFSNPSQCAISSNHLMAFQNNSALSCAEMAQQR